MSAERRDGIILTALLTHGTIRQAAAACGISESVIYSRLRDENFRSEYDRQRRQLVSGATAALQSRLLEAVDVMGQVMADEKNGAQTRLNACEAILRNSLKMTEQTDILERLDRLEQAQAQAEVEG